MRPPKTPNLKGVEYDAMLAYDTARRVRTLPWAMVMKRLREAQYSPRPILYADALAKCRAEIERIDREYPEGG